MCLCLCPEGVFLSVPRIFVQIAGDYDTLKVSGFLANPIWLVCVTLCAGVTTLSVYPWVRMCVCMCVRACSARARGASVRVCMCMRVRVRVRVIAMSGVLCVCV